MSTHIHTIETKWREADAVALEERVQAIGEWLEHTTDLVAMLEGKGDNDELTTGLLSLAGLVRSRRNDLTQAAEKLRASVVDQNSNN